MLALLIWVLGWAGTGFLSDQGELAILKGDFFSLTEDQLPVAGAGHTLLGPTFPQRVLLSM